MGSVGAVPCAAWICGFSSTDLGLNSINLSTEYEGLMGAPWLHSGMRVRAVWKPPSERTAEGVSNRGWGSVASVIDAFEWTGEPDADRSVYEEHIF